MRSRYPCCFAAVLVLCGLTARAPAQAADGGIWQTVSDSQLDQLRGGFDLGGLQVSFGITRSVYINGLLVTETTLNLGDLSKLTAAQALQLNGQLAGLNLVQNGPGNSAPRSLTSSGAGTIIQNTLNNQQINVQTLINASSNGLTMIRNMNAQSTLKDALDRAALPH